ncbi:Sec-independent protein translocase protein TatB [Haliea sp. E17]|uniref:Sec-independent protein translocase protein TatB n=1 Tax=Haliea sp. E17 TaxID=3401576 RepID=UPI003AADA5D4
MFDIGFAELIIVAVVGLLVIGPERLPGAIRTGAAWWSRFRRGFNQIKSEVERELHNDAVMRELKETRREFDEQVQQLANEIEEPPAPQPAEDKAEQRPQ